MESSNSKSLRHVHIYRLMLQRGRMSTSELAKALGVERRVALRWMKELPAELEIRHHEDGVESTWILDPGHAAENLGVLDAITLMLGKGLTTFLVDAGLGDAFDRLHAEERVQPRMRRRLSAKFYCHDEPTRLLGAAREQVETVVDALLRERSLILRYDGTSGQRSYARFDPYTLVLYRRGLYLLGVVPDRPEVLRLAVDRIVEAALGPPMIYPDQWDPADELRTCFGIYQEGGPERITLRFRADRARLVESRSWHPSQTLRRLPDGRVELQMVASGRELVRFVLEWGPVCEVVSPRWLRERVIAELKGALELYGGEV